MRTPRSRRLAAIAAAVAVLSVVGGAGASHAAARQMAQPTTAMLEKALLTVANLPGYGFQEQSLPPGAGVDTFAPCPYIGNGPQPLEEADAALTAGISGIDTVILDEALQQYSVSGAMAQLRQFAATPAGKCHDFTVSVEGLHVHITLAREAFPSLGNGTVALRLTAIIINADYLTFVGDIVAVRHGGTVMVITNTAESQSFNPTLTRIAVSHGYKKVTALL